MVLRPVGSSLVVRSLNLGSCLLDLLYFLDEGSAVIAARIAGRVVVLGFLGREAPGVVEVVGCKLVRFILSQLLIVNLALHKSCCISVTKSHTLSKLLRAD